MAERPEVKKYKHVLFIFLSTVLSYILVIRYNLARKEVLAMSDPTKPQPKPAIAVRVPEHIQGGVYANNMVVGHTREEFVMDFLYVFPNQAVVNARVITSPGHMKRIIRALQDNMRKYEARFGEVKESSDPKEERLVN